MCFLLYRLLVMVVQDEDGSSDCSGQNCVALGELVDFEVPRAFLEVVPVEL